MDKFAQDKDLSLLPEQILQELENSILLESQITGNPWVKATRLRELFYNKYGATLEQEIKLNGYSDSLENFLKSISQRFSIYNHPNPQEFYVAFLHDIVPDCQESQSTATSYESQEAEGSEESPNTYSSENIIITASEYQPKLVSEIKSVNDLESVLIEIIKSLTANNSQLIVTIAVLSQKFYYYYGQPIRGNQYGELDVAYALT